MLVVDKGPDCGLLFARWDKLATLEFDRNRKSMSVIACAAQPTSSTASGVTTRSSAKNSSSNGNVLFVKGAAEYMLNRCSKVCLLAYSMLCHACFASQQTYCACLVSWLARSCISPHKLFMLPGGNCMFILPNGMWCTLLTGRLSIFSSNSMHCVCHQC